MLLLRLGQCFGKFLALLGVGLHQSHLNGPLDWVAATRDWVDNVATAHIKQSGFDGFTNGPGNKNKFTKKILKSNRTSISWLTDSPHISRPDQSLVAAAS